MDEASIDTGFSNIATGNEWVPPPTTNPVVGPFNVATFVSITHCSFAKLVNPTAETRVILDRLGQYRPDINIDGDVYAGWLFTGGTFFRIKPVFPEANFYVKSLTAAAKVVDPERNSFFPKLTPVSITVHQLSLGSFAVLGDAPDRVHDALCKLGGYTDGISVNNIMHTGWIVSPVNYPSLMQLLPDAPITFLKRKRSAYTGTGKHPSAHPVVSPTVEDVQTKKKRKHHQLLAGNPVELSDVSVTTTTGQMDNTIDGVQSFAPGAGTEGTALGMDEGAAGGSSETSHPPSLANICTGALRVVQLNTGSIGVLGCPPLDTQRQFNELGAYSDNIDYDGSVYSGWTFDKILLYRVLLPGVHLSADDKV